MAKNQLLRMDNMGIVVESLDNAIDFFSEIGLQLQGRMMVEGDWAGRITGLGNQRVEIAMNALGYLRAMFTVADIDELVERLFKHGVTLVGEVVQYENSYKLCYIRGAEGLLVGLAQQL